MFPGLENLPKDYIGIQERHGGVVRAQRATELFQELIETYDDAEVWFSSEVVDFEKDHVILGDGEKIHTRHVVMCTGANTMEMNFDRLTEEESKQVPAISK